MPDTLGQTNNISLSDYNFQRDIENRLQMAELSVFDVDVLREILDGSLKNSIKHMAKAIAISEKDLLPTLKKLSKTKLFHQHGDAIIVDKEMRKYYESQILKFDDNFAPDMEFLQGLLSKVPIHALPNWYSIPKMANNIFASIVDNYLLTPKIYEFYLSQLKFKDSILNAIMQDVFHAPDFQIFAHDIMDKYCLTREKFEECMLYLEFNFVCCLGYNKVNDIWEEVVTPFHEWRTYLRFLRDNMPKEIKEEVVRIHPDDFGFVKDLSALLQAAGCSSIILKGKTLSKEDATKFLPHIKDVYESKLYVEQLIFTLVDYSLAEIKNNQLKPLTNAQKWLHKSPQAQAGEMLRYGLNVLRKRIEDLGTYGEKDFRETERSLRRVAKSGWIYFDDFIAGMVAPIGKADAVFLQNKGRRWRYATPIYSMEDKEFVRKVILGPMYMAGYIAAGLQEGRLCFCVTPFGRHAVGE